MIEYAAKSISNFDAFDLLSFAILQVLATKIAPIKFLSFSIAFEQELV